MWAIPYDKFLFINMCIHLSALFLCRTPKHAGTSETSQERQIVREISVELLKHHIFFFLTLLKLIYLSGCSRSLLWHARSSSLTGIEPRPPVLGAWVLATRLPGYLKASTLTECVQDTEDTQHRFQNWLERLERGKDTNSKDKIFNMIQFVLRVPGEIQFSYVKYLAPHGLINSSGPILSRKV